MIRINLLPEDRRRKEPAKITLPDLPIKKTLSVFLALFFGGQLLLGSIAIANRIELNHTQKALSHFKTEHKDLMRIKKRLTLLETRLGQIHRLTREGFYWSTLLSDLTLSVTKGVWLRHVTVVGGEELFGAKGRKKKKAPPGSDKKAKGHYLKIEGSVYVRGEQTAYIGKFIQSLEENKRFRDLFERLELFDIHQRKIKDFDVYDFTVLCRFKDGLL